MRQMKQMQVEIKFREKIHSAAGSNGNIISERAIAQTKPALLASDHVKVMSIQYISSLEGHGKE